jgi:hypothetical protein
LLQRGLFSDKGVSKMLLFFEVWFGGMISQSKEQQSNLSLACLEGASPMWLNIPLYNTEEPLTPKCGKFNILFLDATKC